ncbi:gliding motility-associated C-terminal domain-containing protein [Nisaea acidiphila]|uniref:Basal-body rod modification protein FlgD n=1 Tax=Nisaea acidiphila TaxID=1862145 RepID=A0A9J7AS93_9PROT|nr:flagellar hook capping FlgD N-terminal domain-containing protein [Nisaea acidiphila]UUX50507.1 gliding motility-associated C-terminal domain-containing protein [Nisaea acidiphila]
MFSAVSSTGETSIYAQEQTTSERLEEELSQFMTLFLTQLQNQDPTSPMDTNQMTEQLVQFTSVEQQIEANTLLEELVSAQSGNANSAAVSYINQGVYFDGNTTTLTDGSASWGYLIDSETDADSVSINVFDEDGTLVYTEEGETTAGVRHEFNWDGTDSGGEQLPDGTYSIQVGSLDEENQSIDTLVEAYGLVTGVVTGSDGPSLLIGNVSVGMDEITRVSAT